jgi:hypothetical protein
LEFIAKPAVTPQMFRDGIIQMDSPLQQQTVIRDTVNVGYRFRSTYPLPKCSALYEPVLTSFQIWKFRAISCP